MRQEKRTSKFFGFLGAVILGAFLTACSGSSEDIAISDADSEVKIITYEIDSKEENRESSSADNDSMETKDEDEVHELLPNADGSMEIYSAREIIPLSDDMLVGQVALEDILLGEPILYERIIIDGFVFEWILSNYEDDDDYFSEDGVLIISREDGTGDTQVIHIQGEGGGWGPPIMLKEHKFQYMDVNFDDVPDLLVCSGHHGNQGLVTYYCFLQTDAGFVESPTFTDIPNPSVDMDNKLILGQWRNSAVSHSWAEYKYQGNAYVLDRELREDAEAPEGAKDASDSIWTWTVNGEEIGRSDELSESEIVDLIYSENSEWRIADDRWRTIYNNGLNVDYSIYSDP